MADSIAVVVANIGRRGTDRQFAETKRTAPAGDFIAVRPAQGALARRENANSLRKRNLSGSFGFQTLVERLLLARARPSVHHRNSIAQSRNSFHQLARSQDHTQRDGTSPASGPLGWLGLKRKSRLFGFWRPALRGPCHMRPFTAVDDPNRSSPIPLTCSVRCVGNPARRGASGA
jgi:hypothetical protein